MPIIIIDGLAWSGRHEIAELVAQRLGCEVIGPEELSQLAEQKGLHHGELQSKLERPQDLRERFFESLARLAQYYAVSSAGFAGDPTAGIVPYLYERDPGTDPKSLTEQLGPYLDVPGLRKLLGELFAQLAQRESVVLVGCGSQAAIPSRPGVVKAMVCGSFDLRVRRASVELGLNVEETERRVRQIDRDRAGFLKQVFRAGWTAPTLYDLQLDSGTMPYENAADLVLAAAEAVVPFTTPDEGEAVAG
ncbi:MAG: cytidylate kinase-like family protein [Chloroflexi bacterium]|nr:cytidylate kinase-like family protein [Chloroflexota bacterium]